MAGKERNSSIELLRIIAMLMIVLSHYVAHGGFANISAGGMSFDNYIISILNLGKWAVDIFVLIYAYFSVKSEFKPVRLIRLYAQVWFYSVAIFIAYMLWNRTIYIGPAIRAVMPVISNQYWFFSQYIVLCLLMPFLNILIKNMSRQCHLRLILLLFIVWSFLPSFLPGVFSLYGLGVGKTGAFVLLYFIGAYMRLYPDCRVNEKRIGYLMAIGSFVIMMSIRLIERLHHIPLITIDCATATSSLSIGFAVGMLSLFNSIKIKPNKIINGIAACTFGVYLIHDNDYMRPFLWQYLLKNYKYLNSGYLIPHMIISVFGVFFICIVIEYIRKQTVEKLYIKCCEPWILKKLSKFKKDHNY